MLLKRRKFDGVDEWIGFVKCRLKFANNMNCLIINLHFDYSIEAGNVAFRQIFDEYKNIGKFYCVEKVYYGDKEAEGALTTCLLNVLGKSKDHKIIRKNLLLEVRHLLAKEHYKQIQM